MTTVADKSEKERDDIVFKYEAALDRNGVIDGRELAAKLIDDAFSLLVPYAKGCRECSVSLFAGVGNRVIYRLLEEKILNGRMCSYNGASEEENIKFFEAHRDETQGITDQLLEEGFSAREAAARHEH